MSDADTLLREWAFFFRDRHGQRGTCWSLEGRYRRFLEGVRDEAVDEAPKDEPLIEKNLLRAFKTHEIICTLPVRSRWSVTYYFCYPHLEKWQTLMSLKRWLGYRITWKEHEEAVDLGRMRVGAWRQAA